MKSIQKRIAKLLCVTTLFSVAVHGSPNVIYGQGSGEVNVQQFGVENQTYEISQSTTTDAAVTIEPEEKNMDVGSELPSYEVLYTRVDLDFEDFENDIDGTKAPSPWSIPDSNKILGKNNVISLEYDQDRGKVAEFKTSAASNLMMIRYFNNASSPNITGKVLLEGMFNFKDKSSERRLFMINGSTALALIANKEGKVMLGKETVFHYELDTWYHIQMVIDNDAGKMDLYVNGKKQGTSYDMITGGKIEHIRFIQVGANNIESSMYIDDLKILELKQEEQDKPDIEEPPMEVGNILRNGSFEEVIDETTNAWSTPEKPDEWSTWKASGNPQFDLVEDDAHDGRYAIRISTDEQGRGSASSHDIPVVIGRKYIISAKVKTAETDRPGAKAQARIRVTPYTEDGAQIQGAYKESPLISGVKEWQTVFLEYTIPASTKYIKVGLFMETSTGAKVWYDDVSVTAFVRVTKVDLGADKEIILGDSFTVSPNVEPSNGSQSFNWYSSDDSIATVVDGKVTGVGIGETTITAKWEYDENIQGSIKVNVEKDPATHVEVTGVSFGPDRVEIAKRSFGKLNWSIEPDNATIQKVNFTVEDPEIVLVQNNGEIVGLKQGQTTVTITTEEGNYQDTCTIIVVEAEKDEFDSMRDKWKEQILGTPYNQNDTKVKEILENAATTAQKHWDSMNKSSDRTYLWDNLRETDKELPASKANSAHVRSMYRNILDMTKAYSLPSSSLYGNQQLLTDIIEALDWLSKNHYYAGKAPYSNWWNWEIGVPIDLNDIVVLLYDELSPVQIKKYMDAIEYFQPDPTKSGVNGAGTTSPTLREAVGANRVDVSKAVAIRGVIVKDSEKIAASRDALSQVFEYVETADGFYKDGSFIQHENIPYTGSYGDVLINGVATLLAFLHGSSWEVTDTNVENIYKAVIDSFEPLLYKGAIMDMVSGRAISRPVGDHGRGHGILNAIVNLIPSAPDQYAKYYQVLVKSMIEEDTFKSYLDGIDNMRLYNIALEIANNSSIPHRDSYTEHFQFPSMDRVVHHEKDYVFGIASHSKRIGNYETMNNENTKGWYTGDGMTYLYNTDLGQYTHYWPTVNPYRLPGTTEDTGVRQDNSGQRRFPNREKGMSSKSWVGGVSLADQYGTWGMDFESWDESLEAKKSWFMFDKEIVALGTGIKSTKPGVVVETTVENRKLNQDGMSNIRVGNNEIENTISGQEKIEGATWAHLESSTLGSSIGYYFPISQQIYALKETREGKYADINYSGSNEVIKNDFFTLWIDHGGQPQDEKYEYVLLPNQSVEETKQYSQNPDIMVLANTEEAQGVKNTRLNITGVNFWTDKVQTVDKVTSHSKAAVMMQEKDGEVEISVSDPTMENTGDIKLEVDLEAYKIFASDPRITVEQLHPTIKITVDVNNSKGQSFTVKLGTQKPEEPQKPEENPDKTPGGSSSGSSSGSSKENSRESIENKVEKELKNDNKEIIIPLKEKGLELSLSLLTKIRENSKTIVIDKDKVKVEIPSSIAELKEIQQLAKNDKQRLELEIKINTKEKTDSIGKEIQVEIQGNINKSKLSLDSVSKLEIPVKLSLTLEEQSKIKNPHSVNLYQWDVEKQQWKYVNENLTWNESTVEFNVHPFETYTIIEYNKEFNDTKSHWAKESIERIGSKHILDEMGNESFNPSKEITRAEFAAIIAKALSKNDQESGELIFKDVDTGKWYTQYLGIATDLGLIKGVGQSGFNPEERLTREALAAILMRAYHYVTGEEDISTSGNLDLFKDANNISPWAKQVMIQAYEKGLVQGISKTEMAPKQFATRAQAVVLLDRLLTNRR